MVAAITKKFNPKKWNQPSTQNTLVYIAASNKAFKYRFGKSKIVYIGTTKKGAIRLTQSAVDKSKDLFTLHGIKQIGFYIVTCSSVKNLQSWKKLERAIILTFRHLYGDPPQKTFKVKWN